MNVRSKVLMFTLCLVLVASFGTMAAELQQVMRADGVGLVLTGVNETQTAPLEGYDVGLWLITPEFEGTPQLLGKASAVAVVVGDTVTSLTASGEGEVPPAVPAVPANGYLLLGSGIGRNFLFEFKVGDQVSVVTKEATTDSQAAIALANGTSSQMISAYNRGRQANELIIFTRDFGTHTLTNEWGQDAAVVNGEVVAIRPYGDTGLFEIPEDGFVISVHGAARTWFDANISLGAKVELK